MLFLVDYENVGNAGMRGSSYLDIQDHVIIFYSESKKNVERRYLEDISASGCKFEICKLCKNGKNALDFYIVSRLGELIGEGYQGVSIIVSKDSGFQAARDYWEKRASCKRKVFVSPSMEDGIISGNENNERTKELKRLRESLTIGGYYSAYEERLRLQSLIESLFQGTEYQDRTEEIQELMEGGKKKAKVIYLSSLHTFGRKSGLEIYQKLKESGEF